MTSAQDLNRQGTRKISDLFATFTTEINELDEAIARQHCSGNASWFSSLVRSRLRETFSIELAALKLEHGISSASFS
jgi:hypothetical protein